MFDNIFFLKPSAQKSIADRFVFLHRNMDYQELYRVERMRSVALGILISNGWVAGEVSHETQRELRQYLERCEINLKASKMRLMQLNLDVDYSYHFLCIYNGGMTEVKMQNMTILQMKKHIIQKLFPFLSGIKMHPDNAFRFTFEGSQVDLSNNRLKMLGNFMATDICHLHSLRQEHPEPKAKAVVQPPVVAVAGNEDEPDLSFMLRPPIVEDDIGDTNEADARDEPRGSTEVPAVEDRANQLIHISVKVIDGDETKVCNFTFLPSYKVGAICTSVVLPDVNSQDLGVFLNGYILNNDMDITSLRLGAEDDLVCRALDKDESTFIADMKKNITLMSVNQQIFELNTEGYRCKKVFVLAPTHRAIPIHIAYNFKNETVGDLKQSLGAFLRIDTDDFNEKYALRTARSVLEDWETLFSLLSNFELQNSLPLTLHLVPSLRGAGVRNAFLKRSQDPMVALMKRAKDVLQKRYEKRQETSGDAPLLVKSYITDLNVKMVQWEDKFKSGELTFRQIFEQLDETKLDEILGVINQKAGASEDKISFIAELVMEDISTINKSLSFLTNAKLDLVELFVKQFAVMYAVNRGGSLQFSFDKMSQEISQVQSYRKGLRQIMSVSSGSEPSQVSEGNCSVM